MAYGYPKQFPDYVNLAANAEAEQAFPTTEPEIVGPPDARIGRVRFSGSGLDSAALSVLNALQSQPQPRGGFGTGLVAGLAGGLAGGRVRQMQGRQAANAAEQKRVEREAEYRRRMVSDSARAMRTHQLGVLRDAAKEAAKAKSPSEPMVDIPGVGKVKATSGLGQRYLANKGIVPMPDVVGSRLGDTRAQAAADAAEILDGVMSGDLSANPSDLFSSRDPEIRKQFNILAHQRGFSLLKAQQTQQGYKNYYSTLNGRLQLAVRQSVANAQGGLDLLSELNQKMGTLIPRDSRFTVLNRAALSAAKQGVFGKEARDLAIQMDQQIGNLISELANVYQGGGVPTDEARKQAEANFYGKYAGQQSLEKNIELAKKDVGIRANAILTTGPMTPNTPSGGYPVPPPPPAPGQAVPPAQEAPVVPAKPLGGMFDAVKGTVKKLRGER